MRISPACARALDVVVDTLRRHGHEVIEMYVVNYDFLDGLVNDHSTARLRVHMKEFASGHSLS